MAKPNGLDRRYPRVPSPRVPWLVSFFFPSFVQSLTARLAESNGLLMQAQDDYVVWTLQVKKLTEERDRARVDRDEALGNLKATQENVRRWAESRKEKQWELDGAQAQIRELQGRIVTLEETALADRQTIDRLSGEKEKLREYLLRCAVREDHVKQVLRPVVRIMNSKVGDHMRQLWRETDDGDESRTGAPVDSAESPDDVGPSPGQPMSGGGVVDREAPPGIDPEGPDSPGPAGRD